MLGMMVYEVVDYLTDGFNEEDKSFKKLVKWYFKMSRYTSKIENEEARKCFLELQKIKKSYQTGASFVKNQTKGEKKGFNYRYATLIENMLKRGKKEEAIEYAKSHLDYVKRLNSERTYYYHKKRIRSLGIEI